MFIDFSKRGRETEREWGRRGGKNIDVREKFWLVASCKHPDWGLNPQPFSVWYDAPTNWATRPGPYFYVKLEKYTSLLVRTVPSVCSWPDSLQCIHSWAHHGNGFWPLFWETVKRSVIWNLPSRLLLSHSGDDVLREISELKAWK